jgi:hypothetical protein
MRHGSLSQRRTNARDLEHFDPQPADTCYSVSSFGLVPLAAAAALALAALALPLCSVLFMSGVIPRRV